MNLFYKPENGWCADVIPFYKDGVYYLYYLHDYRDAENFGEGTPWYLLTTKDFVHYKEYGEVLCRGTKEEHDLYIFTGCVFEDTRQVTPYPYHIYYTAHNPHYPKAGKPLEMIKHAVSKDLIHWEKQDDIAYTAPEGYERDDWRDPFIWYSEEKQAYCMLTAARNTKGPSNFRGCTALSVSRNLIDWEATAPMLDEGSYYTHECPDYFYWNGWYYLIFSEFSSTCRTRYRMARSPFGPWEKPKDDMFDARGFYAAKTAGSSENRYIFGWNTTREGETDNGRWMWGANLVVHELKQRENGTLYTVLPETIARAYPTPTQAVLTGTFGDVTAENQSTCLNAVLQTAMAQAGPMRENMVLKVSFQPEKSVHFLGVTLCISEDESQMYFAGYDYYAKRLAIGKWPPQKPEYGFMPETERFFDLTPGEDVSFRIFKQGSLLEIYLQTKQDGAALSTRIYDLKGGSYGVMAQGGTAQVTCFTGNI